RFLRGRSRVSRHDRRLSGSNRWAFAARSFSTRGDTVTSLVERLDRYVGAAIGGAVIAHHRRRLRRCGWVEAFDADANDWARGTPPPRTGCSLELLIDGGGAAPRLGR